MPSHGRRATQIFVVTLGEQGSAATMHQAHVLGTGLRAKPDEILAVGPR